MKSIYKTFLKSISLFAALVLPAVVYAQATPAEVFLERVGAWVSLATPVLSAIALLVFIWGVVRFIAGAGDEEKRKDGKRFMVWGIVALFVIVAIWGIVYFVAASFGVGIGGSAAPPCVSGVPGSNCGTGGTSGGTSGTSGTSGGSVGGVLI